MLRLASCPSLLSVPIVGFGSNHSPLQGRPLAWPPFLFCATFSDPVFILVEMQISTSLHPYFAVKAGKFPEVQALLNEFVAQTANEGGMLCYEFTISGEVLFCREAYLNADAVLAHLANVGPLLDRMLGLAELVRLEVHGPAAELDKLRAPLSALNPTWFTYECGVTR